MSNLIDQAKSFFAPIDPAGVVENKKQIDSYTAPTASAAKAKSAPSPSDKVNPKGKYGQKSGEKRIDTKDMTKPLGSFKKGGKVPKTGLYKLHKGEKVVTAKKVSALSAVASRTK